MFEQLFLFYYLTKTTKLKCEIRMNVFSYVTLKYAIAKFFIHNFELNGTQQLQFELPQL